VSGGAEVLVGLVIAVGLVGVLVPVLPGLVLVLAAIAFWAVRTGSTGGWVVLAVAVGLFVVGTVVKYVLPGRRLRRAGVPWPSTALGGLVGVVGFFLIPVVGLLIGFVLGVYAAEWVRLRSHEEAWRSTRQALAAAGLSMLVELGAGVAMALVWLVGVLA
jgi:uncharacterized protein YqgC (DUF456 family)